MSSIVELWRDLLIKYELNDDTREEEHRFIERLTFSSFSEIEAVLDDVYQNNFMAMPVWIRNLAHRLACLLEPENAEMHRRAASDLRLFGPDWDKEADELDAQAERLEKR